MRLLFGERGRWAYCFREPMFRSVPRCLALLFPERPLWGKPMIAPVENPLYWLELPCNWGMVYFRDDEATNEDYS